MTDQLVNHLADVIRRYTKNPYADGGRRPDGMKVLQRGRRRNIALDDVPKPWPEGSTVPEQVAPILLGIKFDKRKLVASMFDAAWEVARLLNLELTWEDDFKLGAFLISCLTKAGYYDIKDIYQFGDRIEYGLFAKKQAVKDFPASDPCTRFEPFPKWDSAIDADGWWLVKPSHPQLKHTFWQPEDTKGKRKRLVALNGAAYEALLRLRRVAQDNFPETPWVFTHTRPRNKGERIQSVQKVWGTAVERAGIAWCTPHCLRHTHITEAVHAEGANLSDIARGVGHRNTKTTEGYIAVADDRLHNAVANLPTIVRV